MQSLYLNHYNDLDKRGLSYYSTPLVAGTVPANTFKELTSITVQESGTYLLMVFCYISSPISSNLIIKYNNYYWWDLFFYANEYNRPIFVRPMRLNKGDIYSLVLESKPQPIEIQTPNIILTRLY